MGHLILIATYQAVVDSELIALFRDKVFSLTALTLRSLVLIWSLKLQVQGQGHCTNL